jgi:hypothetical protein
MADGSAPMAPADIICISIKTGKTGQHRPSHRFRPGDKIGLVSPTRLARTSQHVWCRETEKRAQDWSVQRRVRASKRAVACFGCFESVLRGGTVVQRDGYQCFEAQRPWTHNAGLPDAPAAVPCERQRLRLAPSPRRETRRSVVQIDHCLRGLRESHSLPSIRHISRRLWTMHRRVQCALHIDHLSSQSCIHNYSAGLGCGGNRCASL